MIAFHHHLSLESDVEKRFECAVIKIFEYYIEKKKESIYFNLIPEK